MFAFRIEKPPEKFPFPNAWKQTWSVATLTDLGDGRTVLRLSGVGYTADEESQKMRAFFQAGNAWTLKRLASHFDAAVKPDMSRRRGPASCWPCGRSGSHRRSRLRNSLPRPRTRCARGVSRRLRRGAQRESS